MVYPILVPIIVIFINECFAKFREEAIQNIVRCWGRKPMFLVWINFIVNLGPVILVKLLLNFQINGLEMIVFPTSINVNCAISYILWRIYFSISCILHYLWFDLFNVPIDSLLSSFCFNLLIIVNWNDIIPAPKWISRPLEQTYTFECFGKRYMQLHCLNTTWAHAKSCYWLFINLKARKFKVKFFLFIFLPRVTITGIGVIFRLLYFSTA